MPQNVLDYAKFKGIVDPKMKILSIITQPRAIPIPRDLRSSLEHKLRYRAPSSSIDSNCTDVNKIDYMFSVV